MHIPSPRLQRKARIEIIPLIDIVFFLLATFILISTSVTKDHGIPIKMPASTTSQRPNTPPTIVLSLTADGQLFFNKEPVPRHQLAERLRQENPYSIAQPIFIRAATNTYFGEAITLLDEVRKLGITQIFIQTSPMEAERGQKGY